MLTEQTLSLFYAPHALPPCVLGSASVPSPSLGGGPAQELLASATGAESKFVASGAEDELPLALNSTNQNNLAGRVLSPTASLLAGWMRDM